MAPNSILERLQNSQQNSTDFYTPAGLHVYFKEAPINDEIDVESVVAKLESKVPMHILSCVEMIIIGDFKEFHERSINAFYDSGAVYISNLQDNNDDIYDDLIHEYAHAVEKNYNVQIYSDNAIESEFLSKRLKLETLLDYEGYDVEQYSFMNSDYDLNFDIFLHNEVGYEKLRNIDQGMFLNSYSVTSLTEYFATSFEEYYLRDRRIVKKVTPAVFSKIDLVHQGDIEYDNQTRD